MHGEYTSKENILSEYQVLKSENYQLKSELRLQEERANKAVNLFQEMRRERDDLQKKLDQITHIILNPAKED